MKQEIEELFKARDEFLALLDELVPKKNGTDVFDFENSKPVNLKEIYAKFYAYDYKVRRMMPKIYKAFDIK